MRASFVRNRQRARLFDLWTFLVLVLLLLTALVLVFPHQLSLRAVDYIERPTAVSLAYLQALVRAYPEDDWLRLQLARQYREIGQFPQANVVLQPLLGPEAGLVPDLAAQVRWLKARLDHDRMLTLPVGSPRRAELQRSLRRQLETLASSERADAQDLRWLAQTALTLNRPRLAAQVYERLAEMPEENRADRLMAAGRWYLAANAFELAVDAYRRVLSGDGAADRRVEAGLALVRTWLAAGRPERAWQEAESLLTRFPGNISLLELAQQAALQAGDPRRALAFAQQHWPSRADMGVRALRERLDLELAAGRTSWATETAGILVQRRPDDGAARRDLARLLEWTGQPYRALEVWLRVAEREGSGAREPPVWQLALDLYAFETAQRLLLDVLASRLLEADELRALSWASAQAGEPERAIEALTRVVDGRGGDEAHWRYLLTLLRETDQRAAWLARIERFDRRFGVDTALRLVWARQLMAEQSWEKALAVLEAGRPPDPGQALAYWQAVAGAALTLQRLERAAEAYEALAGEGERLDVPASQQLLALALFLGRDEQALSVADRLWRDTGDPYYLVVALRRADELGRQRYIERVTVPTPVPAERYPDYWRFLAEYRQRSGASATAGKAYRRALALAPGDASLRAGYLWHLIDTRQRDTLAERLREWSRPGAVPAVQAALAAGYQFLGRYREALVWYRREAPQRRREWLWLLGYADALDEAGLEPAAFRLRRYVLHGLWRSGRDLAPAQAVARADLVRELSGPPAAYALVPSGGPDGAWYPLLAGWYLDSDLTMAARRIMLEAHARRLELPAWQRLGLALADNDLRRVERLLAKARGLSRLDRSVAEQRLGRDGKALALAQDAIDGGREDGTARALATSLSSAVAPGAQGIMHYAWNADIGVARAEALLRRPVGEGLFEVSARTRESRAPDLLSGGPLGSNALTFGWEGGGYRQPWSVSLGVEGRDGRARPVAGVALTRSPARDMTAGLTLSWNAEPQASLLLDSLTGYRGAGASARWDLTGRSTVSARIRYGEYVDWWTGEAAVSGADGNLGLSEMISTGPVRWRLGLGVDWQAYRREDQATGAFGGRLNTGVEGDRLALETVQVYRIASRWQHGQAGELAGRGSAPRWHLDVGAGWQSPQDELVLGLDAALGWPVVGGDELALRVSYSDNATAAEAFQAGAGVTYTYWFGR
ncbi:tetratricopeptide repeat protein [Ectothiorhodospiraceae bacterium WFHF3C12]|nr:tetratricopeptide repeat protein [Ectothiorhodospiraceae bacterium WFHF3C12]